MIQQNKYRFFEDDGHAWLEVPHAEVDASGMSVTPYSSYDPDTDLVYLEEDVDLIAFFKASGKTLSDISCRIYSSKPRQLPSYSGRESKQ